MLHIMRNLFIYKLVYVGVKIYGFWAQLNSRHTLWRPTDQAIFHILSIRSQLRGQILLTRWVDPFWHGLLD